MSYWLYHNPMKNKTVLKKKYSDSIEIMCQGNTYFASPQKKILWSLEGDAERLS